MKNYFAGLFAHAFVILLGGILLGIPFVLMIYGLFALFGAAFSFWKVWLGFYLFFFLIAKSHFREHGKRIAVFSEFRGFQHPDEHLFRGLGK